MSVPGDSFADLFAGGETACAVSGPPLHELHHDLTEPMAMPDDLWLTVKAVRSRHQVLRRFHDCNQETRSIY
jgi:hypothetical protein